MKKGKGGSPVAKIFGGLTAVLALGWSVAWPYTPAWVDGLLLVLEGFFVIMTIACSPSDRVHVDTLGNGDVEPSDRQDV